jgi:hypothetical protein
VESGDLVFIQHVDPLFREPIPVFGPSQKAADNRDFSALLDASLIVRAALVGVNGQTHQERFFEQGGNIPELPQASFRRFQAKFMATLVCPKYARNSTILHLSADRIKIASQGEETDELVGVAELIVDC